MMSWGWKVCWFFFSSRRRHTRWPRDWSSDVCSSDLGELLEFHQREIGLDAGGVAIHHQADGAGRRHHGRLRVAIAVRLAERERAIPGAPGRSEERRVGKEGRWGGAPCRSVGRGGFVT